MSRGTDGSPSPLLLFKSGGQGLRPTTEGRQRGAEAPSEEREVEEELKLGCPRLVFFSK